MQPHLELQQGQLRMRAAEIEVMVYNDSAWQPALYHQTRGTSESGCNNTACIVPFVLYVFTVNMSSTYMLWWTWVNLASVYVEEPFSWLIAEMLSYIECLHWSESGRTSPCARIRVCMLSVHIHTRCSGHPALTDPKRMFFFDVWLWWYMRLWATLM